MPNKARMSVTYGNKAVFLDEDGKFHNVEITVSVGDMSDGEITMVLFADGSVRGFVDADLGALFVDKNSEEARRVHEADARAPLPTEVLGRDRCDPACKGWTVFERGDGYLDVERCHDCNVFPYDDDAVPFAHAAGIQTTPEGPFYVIGLDVKCGDCGDTGFTELNGAFCHCAAGRKAAAEPSLCSDPGCHGECRTPAHTDAQEE